MANAAKSAHGAAKQNGGALARGFAALGYPKCMSIVVVSAILSVLLGIGLWYLLQWAVIERHFFDWAWVNWLMRQFGSVALFFLLLLMFPAIMAIVMSCLFDIIIDEVERRHYPDLPPKRHQSPGELIGYIAKFTALILIVNFIALPFYLLLPGINFLIAWTANGYIFGREYYEAVAMRRLAPPEMRALRQARGGQTFRAGFVLAMLKTIPIFGLVIPVVGCAYLTHLFHAMPWRDFAKR